MSSFEMELNIHVYSEYSHTASLNIDKLCALILDEHLSQYGDSFLDFESLKVLIVGVEEITISRFLVAQRENAPYIGQCELFRGE
jgi:hypothetical protein